MTNKTLSADQDQIFAIYAGIATACVLAGLGASDAEDVAQDIWEWVLRSGNMAAAAIAPWLTAVTANFVRRHWRRKLRERTLLREFGAGFPLKSESWSRQTEAKLFLDRLASRSPSDERRLLVLMRQGLCLSEAGTRLGIPKGSQQFRMRNLRKEAQRIRHPSHPRRGHRSAEG